MRRYCFLRSWKVKGGRAASISTTPTPSSPIGSSEAKDAFCLCVISHLGDEQSDGDLLTLVSPILAFPSHPAKAAGPVIRRVSSEIPPAPSPTWQEKQMKRLATVEVQVGERGFPDNAGPWTGVRNAKGNWQGDPSSNLQSHLTEKTYF